MSRHRAACRVLGSLGALVLAALPTASLRADDPVLHLRFVPGRTVVHRIQVEKSIGRLDGQGITIPTRLVYTLRRETRDLLRDGAARVALRLDRIEMEIVAPQGQRLDTNEPPAEGEPEVLAAMRRVVGQPFAATLTPTGEVTAFAVPPGAAEENDALGQAVSAAALQGLLRMQHSWVPREPIEAGRPWSRSEELREGAVAMTRKNTLRVVGHSGSRYRIQSRIELADVGAEPQSAGEATLRSVVLPGEKPGSATIEFDAATGLVEKVDAEVTFGIRFDVVDDGSGQPGGSFGQQVWARSEVRLLEVDGRPTDLAGSDEAAPRR